MQGSILFVCTGNICRSPVGEAALRSLLPGTVTISSAGTHAAVGRPAAPETETFLSRELGIKIGHAGQQLSKQQAEAADLIITMTAEHRAWVARTAPRVVRRAFTLRELEQTLAYVPEEQRFDTLREFALAASRLRARIANNGDALDIADPYGGPPEGYEASFQEVLSSTRQVADALLQHSPTV